MAIRRSSRNQISRAGWLFADLSIILMILFAATTIKSSNECKDASSMAPECSSPSSTSPNFDAGFRPEPIKVVVPNASKMSSRTLSKYLEQKIAEAGLPDTYFGVIIVYGGSRGADSSVGDRSAMSAQQKLSIGWDRVKKYTFFEVGHASDLPIGYLSFKLFPFISESADS